MKGLKTLLQTMQTLVLCAAALPIAVFCAYALVRADTESRARPEREAISISATFAQTWQQDRETVHLLRGQCQIVQGGTTIRAERRNGIRQYEVSAPVGDTWIGTLSTTAGLPCPTAKKSPSGTSTEGSVSPSQ